MLNSWPSGSTNRLVRSKKQRKHEKQYGPLAFSWKTQKQYNLIMFMQNQIIHKSILLFIYFYIFRIDSTMLNHHMFDSGTSNLPWNHRTMSSLNYLAATGQMLGDDVLECL